MKLNQLKTALAVLSCSAKKKIKNLKAWHFYKTRKERENSHSLRSVDIQTLVGFVLTVEQGEAAWVKTDRETESERRRRTH